MPLYISSKGEQIDTADMNEKYLERAYNKAVAEGNENNKLALEEEMLIRKSNE